MDTKNKQFVIDVRNAQIEDLTTNSAKADNSTGAGQTKVVASNKSVFITKPGEEGDVSEPASTEAVEREERRQRKKAPRKLTLEDDPDTIMKGLDRESFHEIIKQLQKQCHFMISLIDEDHDQESRWQIKSNELMNF